MEKHQRESKINLHHKPVLVSEREARCFVSSFLRPRGKVCISLFPNRFSQSSVLPTRFCGDLRLSNRIEFSETSCRSCFVLACFPKEASWNGFGSQSLTEAPKRSARVARCARSLAALSSPRGEFGLGCFGLLCAMEIRSWRVLDASWKLYHYPLP